MRERRRAERRDPQVILAFESYKADRGLADANTVLRLCGVRTLAGLPDSQGPYLLSLLRLSPLELVELAADRRREQRRAARERRRARAGRATSG